MKKQLEKAETTHIKISFWFIAVITLMVLFDNKGNSLMSLTAIFLHEFAHIFFIVIFGGKITNFSLCLCEMNIKTEKEFLSKLQNIIISLAGPLMNITLTLLFWNTYINFAKINLVIGVFQILPIISLDGDAVLENLTVKKSSRKIISFILLFLLFFIGISLLFYSKYNFSLLCVSLYLIYLSIKF